MLTKSERQMDIQCERQTNHERQMLIEAHLAMAVAMSLSLSQLRQYFHPLSGVAPHFHAPTAPKAPTQPAEQLATRVHKKREADKC